ELFHLRHSADLRPACSWPYLLSLRLLNSRLKPLVLRLGLCARSSQFSLQALRRPSTDQCRTINISRNSNGAHDPEQIQPTVISWLKSLEEPASSNAPDVVVQLD